MEKKKQVRGGIIEANEKGIDMDKNSRAVTDIPNDLNRKKEHDDSSIGE